MADDRYDKVTFRGKTVDKYTRAALLAVEKELGYELTIVQGSYNNGVGASAGTHNGGGAVDLTAYDWARKVKALRKYGFAAWYRPTISGLWSAHVHAVQVGNTKASTAAKNQVTAYRNHRNGLANNAVDNSWRPSPIVAFTYPVAKVAKVVAKTNLRPMTYNLPDEAKLPNACNRVPAAVALIKSGNPTFVMMQECVGINADGDASAHAAAIDEAFGAGWAIVVPTRVFNENYIWYDYRVLLLMKQYVDKILPSAGGGRHITRAVFKHKESGFIFAVGNTHLVNDHDGVKYEESRQIQGVKAMQAMEDVAALHNNCAIIIGGDMNTVNPIKAFEDANLSNLDKNAIATTNTKYQSYANIKDSTPNLGGQIDQMYASPGFVHNGLTLLLGLANSTYWPALRPSDHVPVVASITTL